jgi:hypothetical protein
VEDVNHADQQCSETTAPRKTEENHLRGGFVRISVALYLLIHSSAPESILPSSCRGERSDVLDLELHVLVVSSHDDRIAARNLLLSHSSSTRNRNGC